jgi:hypothetical protein
MNITASLFIDLNTAVKGQKLLTSQGHIVTYDRPIVHDLYAHAIIYENGSEGTRTNDGFVYKNPASRLETDHDIVAILPLDFVA